MQGLLYIISAASGVGKTSLVSRLLERDKHIQVSISTTTRQIRPGEEDGVNYHFVSLDQFQAKVTEGDFLEHAQVFDNFYGTSKSSVEEKLKQGKDVILEIDWQGAQQVRKIIPKAISISILPPSLTELNRRLTGRGTDSQEIIDGRMAEAVSEMKHFDESDYLVINNDFETALQELHTIFLANRLNLNRQKINHRNLIKELIKN
jgi:guanylate kinase